MAGLNKQEQRIKDIENNLMNVYEFTKTLTVTSGQWTDTGINLPTGTYFMKVYVYTAYHGGNQWKETYSGICSMYNADNDINDDDITEIPVTNAGHGNNGEFCTFGFKRVSRSNTGQQCIVISANENFTDCPIDFYFRRVL